MTLQQAPDETMACPADNEPWDWISVSDRPAASEDNDVEDNACVAQDCCFIEEAWSGDDEIDTEPQACDGKSTAALATSQDKEENTSSLSSSAAVATLDVDDSAASAASAAAAAEAAEAEWMSTHVELELRNVKLVSKEAGGVMQLGIKEGSSAATPRGNVLPIHMGEAETSALIRHTARKSGAPETGRPMTHDLMVSTILACGGRVARVDVHDFQRTTYYAQVHMACGGDGGADGAFDVETKVVDARPSDAVNLAVRAGARIFATKQVMDLMSRAEK